MRSLQKLHIENEPIAHLVTSSSCPEHLNGYRNAKPLPSLLAAALLRREREALYKPAA